MEIHCGMCDPTGKVSEAEEHVTTRGGGGGGGGANYKMGKHTCHGIPH